MHKNRAPTSIPALETTLILNLLTENTQTQVRDRSREKENQ